MNVLPAKILNVSEPYYNPSMKLWIIEVKYHCYGSDSISKYPYKTEEAAKNSTLKVGGTIYV